MDCSLRTDLSLEAYQQGLPPKSTLACYSMHGGGPYDPPPDIYSIGPGLSFCLGRRVLVLARVIEAR